MTKRSLQSKAQTEGGESEFIVKLSSLLIGVTDVVDVFNVGYRFVFTNLEKLNGSLPPVPFDTLVFPMDEKFVLI